jgi:hypothetical protein
MGESIIATQVAYHISRRQLGRRRLAEITGLTEMVVRSELERLRARKWIILHRSGARLTPAGRRRFAVVIDGVRAIESLELKTLHLDTVSLGAVMVALPQLPSAWMLRDCAIREGASGLLLLHRIKEGWTFSHNEEPVGRHNPEDADEIEERFASSECGDTLLIACGSELRVCALGLWGAVVAALQGVGAR